MILTILRSIVFIFLELKLIKAILDTCFLEKFKKGTNISPDFNLLMTTVGFELLIHPYVYEYEMNMSSYANKIINQNGCRVVDYSDFISSEAFRLYYRGLFIEIYNEFYKRLVSLESPKVDKMHLLDEKTNVFEVRFSGSSIGDVHIILMALFMNIPIILSEDSDMELIYSIAKSKVNSDQYQLNMYRIKDVIDYIKSKDMNTISGKELRRLKRAYD